MIKPILSGYSFSVWLWPLNNGLIVDEIFYRTDRASFESQSKNVQRN